MIGTSHSGGSLFITYSSTTPQDPPWHLGVHRDALGSASWCSVSTHGPVRLGHCGLPNGVVRLERDRTKGGSSEGYRHLSWSRDSYCLSSNRTSPSAPQVNDQNSYRVAFRLAKASTTASKHLLSSILGYLPDLPSFHHPADQRPCGEAHCKRRHDS